jgi:hypothetical protein
MFLLYREIPELVKLMPAELWLIVQRIMFESYRNEVLRKLVLLKRVSIIFTSSWSVGLVRQNLYFNVPSLS